MNSNRTPEDVAADLEQHRCMTDLRAMVVQALIDRSPQGSGITAGISLQYAHAKHILELADEAASALRSAESRVEKLKPYLQHMPRCGTYTTTTGANCTCGFTLLEI